jgi:phenylpropionate dioxygenase-like ring-hydroxylating dioxygenase large terminal subunit
MQHAMLLCSRGGVWASPGSAAQAYMISDTCLFLLPYTPDDYLFIGHHIMTRCHAHPGKCQLQT